MTDASLFNYEIGQMPQRAAHVRVEPFTRREGDQAGRQATERLGAMALPTPMLC